MNNSTLNLNLLATINNSLYTVSGIVIMLCNCILLTAFAKASALRRPELFQMFNLSIGYTVFGAALSSAGVRRLYYLVSGQSDKKVTNWFCWTTVPQILFVIADISRYILVFMFAERCYAILSVNYKVRARKISIFAVSLSWFMIALSLALDFADAYSFTAYDRSIICFTEEAHTGLYNEIISYKNLAVDWLLVVLCLFVILPLHKRRIAKISPGTSSRNVTYTKKEQRVTKNIVNLAITVIVLRILPVAFISVFMTYFGSTQTWVLKYLQFAFVIISMSYAANFFVLVFGSSDIRAAILKVFGVVVAPSGHSTNRSITVKNASRQAFVTDASARLD